MLTREKEATRYELIKQKMRELPEARMLRQRAMFLAKNGIINPPVETQSKTVPRSPNNHKPAVIKDEAYFAAKIQKRRDKERHHAHTNLNFKIKRNMRSRVSRAIKSFGTRSSTTMKMVNCTVDQLRLHIESLWKPGMNWGNYTIHGWHIDHIKPCASFDLTDPAQQRECFNYTNLQPLWAKDNWSKGDRII